MPRGHTPAERDVGAVEAALRAALATAGRRTRASACLWCAFAPVGPPERNVVGAAGAAECTACPQRPARGVRVCLLAVVKRAAISYDSLVVVRYEAKSGRDAPSTKKYARRARASRVGAVHERVALVEIILPEHWSVCDRPSIGRSATAPALAGLRLPQLSATRLRRRLRRLRRAARSRRRGVPPLAGLAGFGRPCLIACVPPLRLRRSDSPGAASSRRRAAACRRCSRTRNRPGRRPPPKCSRRARSPPPWCGRSAPHAPSPPAPST